MTFTTRRKPSGAALIQPLLLVLATTLSARSLAADTGWETFAHSSEAVLSLKPEVFSLVKRVDPYREIYAESVIRLERPDKGVSYVLVSLAMGDCDTGRGMLRAGEPARTELRARPEAAIDNARPPETPSGRPPLPGGLRFSPTGTAPADDIARRLCAQLKQVRAESGERLPVQTACPIQIVRPAVEGVLSPSGPVLPSPLSAPAPPP